MIRIFDTRFPGAKLFEPDVFTDERGYFKETYSREKYAELGVHDTFVQDNISRSGRNVVRGMHYDMRLSKFVQCLSGAIYDAIVDMRPDSPDYLAWEGYELSGENHRQLYVPPGFAHGFLALTDNVIVAYKQSEHHDPAHERGVAWDDPAIGIVWPVDGAPVLSPKDRAWAPVGGPAK